MTRLNIENDDRGDNTGRRDADQQPGIMKVLTVTLGAITIFSLVFAVGYNWRGVDELKSHEDQWVRKDVQSEQQRNILQAVSELSRQVEELRGEVKARRKE